MLNDILERVQKRLTAVGLSAQAASVRAGLSKDAIRNMQRAIQTTGRDGVSTKTISALAPILETSVAWLLEGEGDETIKPHMIPIVGLAGAGPDGSVMFATGDGFFGETPAPVNAIASTEALEVRGDSMRGIANDGWIITYDEKKNPDDEHIGEPCVCWLEDDRVLVKIPFPGRGSGLFDLESINAPIMRDIPVRYFALVTNIVPRKAAQKFIKRNPKHPLSDLKVG